MNGPFPPGAAPPPHEVPPAAAAPVPPGPGVQPPFAAAPTEGRTARLWLGLGVAGAALALCCGGGVAAFGALVVTGLQALDEQADRVVGDYFDAVIAEDWERAYGRLCERDRRAESLAAFSDRVAAEPQIASYQLGDLKPTSPDLRLPADLNYVGGGSERVEVPLEQNTTTGDLEVCGFRR
jgi:hypothetical protein